MTLTIDEKSPYYEHDLKLMRKADATFAKMMREIEMLCEYVEQDKLHLLEYKLSKNTRRIYGEIKHQNNIAFKKLLEEAVAADATTAANPALDTGKNILGLINKFHQDNSAEIGLLSSDDTFKTSMPKNIGAQPGILKKIASRALIGSGSGLGQKAVNFLMSILIGAFQKMEKTYSQFKSDYLDAKKQGDAWKFIYSKVGVGMSVAKKTPDGTIEYVQDSSGPGLLNWIKDFLKANPKWTNLAIGLLVNLAKAKAALLAVSLGASVSGALAVGVIVGLVLRTLYGRLKGEDWSTAIKKAAVVTGLALIGGSITKGFFSLLKGGGFFDGAKEYFTGVPGAGPAPGRGEGQAVKSAIQQSGEFKPANSEVEQILARAGLPPNATSERVFSKGVNGVFGKMSMDPNNPFPESTNKLNRFLLNYVKESSSQGQSSLSADGFFNYLHQKTGVPINSLSQMIESEYVTHPGFIKKSLTHVLKQAANEDADGPAKDSLYARLYAFSEEMMETLSVKMKQDLALMRDFGVSPADVAKQSAIIRAGQVGRIVRSSPPQSMASLGFNNESIYKKMIKNLYL